MSLKFQPQSILIGDLPLGTPAVSELDLDENVPHPKIFLVTERETHHVITKCFDPKTGKENDVRVIKTFRVYPGEVQ